MSRLVNLNKAGANLQNGGEGTFDYISKIGKSASGLFNKNTLLYIVAAILFLCLVFFIYYYFIASKLAVAFKPNREHIPIGEQGTLQAELILFSVDWCPHCKTAKPVWEELQADYKNKTINGYQVVFTDINCTNETPEIEKLMNKYKIEGYPTIKLLKDGQVIEFDAKPTKENLNQFLNTVL
jgi:thiol-disulfide isomerase/thioredoxin